MNGVCLGVGRAEFEKTWGRPETASLEDDEPRRAPSATARAPRDARRKRTLTVDNEGWLAYRCGSRTILVQYGVPDGATSTTERVEALKGTTLEKDGVPITEEDLVRLGLRRNTTEELPSASMPWQRRSTALHVYSPPPRLLDASTQELLMVSIDTTNQPPVYFLERTLVSTGRPNPSSSPR